MKTIKLKSGTELPLMNLKGKDYLQVQWRIVWMREEHPDWSIITEYVYQNEQSALAKATIYTATGQVMATSHKEESLVDFSMGFREKAETGAIGRALALCGYGTQFEPEFDEEGRIVDSPIQPKGAVVPEQPAPTDGVQREGFVMPQMPKGFEHLTKKYLEDIHLDELRKVAESMETKYKDKEMPKKTSEFYDVIVGRIVQLEGGCSD